MEKQITIKIDKKGLAKGTVGYLLESADHIKIGVTKNNNQAAWLRGKENETIACLCVRGFFGDDAKLILMENVVDYEDNSASGFIWSDAAWEKIEELQEEVAKIMDELWNENLPEHKLIITLDRVLL